MVHIMSWRVCAALGATAAILSLRVEALSDADIAAAGWHGASNASAVTRAAINWIRRGAPQHPQPGRAAGIIRASDGHETGAHAAAAGARHHHKHRFASAKGETHMAQSAMDSSNASQTKHGR